MVYYEIFQSYRKIARQVSTPDSAPAGLGSPQAGIGGLQQHQQQQQQQQAQQPLHQPDPMQQAKDNLNPAASQQTAALRNGNPPPPVVSMVIKWGNTDSDCIVCLKCGLIMTIVLHSNTRSKTLT
ncbi:hypothetical protein M0804_004812 [Polistes exclamans]|nr:hypothetical protein M0804_004812 [Polistes exclamans]